MDQSSVQAQGYRVGGDIQVEEAVEGKLLRVWGNSDGVFLEGEHGEVAWQKCNAEEGGGNWEGGGYLYVVLPLGAEDDEMSSDRIPVSSA